MTGPRAADAPYYRPELDALRLVAFVFVFLRHTTPNSAAWWARLGLGNVVATVLANASQAGAFGVYLFYLLSAYLITQLLLREKARYGRILLGHFYTRRILRIWPLYLVFLAIACGYARCVGEPIDWAMLPFALLFIANWSGIWHGAVTPTANHLWSISVEEQFYVLCPPLIAYTSRRTLTWVALAMIAAPAIAIPLGPDLYTYALMNSVSCFAAMGAGMLIANLRSDDATPPIPRWMSIVVGLSCWYVASALGLGSSTGRSLVGVLLIVLGSAALLGATLGCRPHSIVRYLGKISYGLYVYHLLAIAVVERLVDKKAIGLSWYPLIMALELALTIAAAATSYRYLEVPFLRIKERFALVKSRPL
jgi:peptidoglycan/LPS O-acetylase OafA/YrhL